MTMNTMTIHYRGTKVLHQIKGSWNFGIDRMMDGNGDWPPKDTIELTQVWHKDGKNRFVLMLKREDFWFRNGSICEAYCNDNDTKIKPKFWKRTKEAREFKLRLLLNKQIQDEEDEEEEKMKRGEILSEDSVEFEHWNDVDSETDGDPTMGLLEQRGTKHWDSDTDDDYFSSDEESEEDKPKNTQGTCASIIPEQSVPEGRLGEKKNEEWFPFSVHVRSMK